MRSHQALATTTLDGFGRRRASIATLAVFGALLVGCGGRDSPPTAPSDLLLSNAAAGPQQSVTGHAEFVNPNTGNRLRYSISAIRHSDGRVTGEVEEHVDVAATGAFVRKIHATVTCFTIVGNEARLGGVIDRAVLAVGEVPPGTEALMTVVDNGERAGDPPDRASPAITGPAQVHCATGLVRPLIPIERGNLQVRP